MKATVFKVIYCFLILSFFFSAFRFYSAKTKAADLEFLHDIRADYIIRPDKSAHVTYNISTQNKQNNYLKTFAFTLPFNPQNVDASLSPTPIKSKPVTTVGNLFELDIDIVNPIYGINKRFDWSINFDVPNILLEHGALDALVLPTFFGDSSISSYSINITLPKVLGDIQYTYGNAIKTETPTTTQVTYLSSTNAAQNIVLLLGSTAEYYLETKKTNTLVFLPQSTAYQKVVYTKFPRSEISLDTTITKDAVVVHDNEVINAFIRTQKGYETLYSKEFENYSNSPVVRNIVSKLQAENIAKQDIPLRAFQFIGDTLELNNYLTNTSTAVNIRDSRRSFNPTEVNQIFREVLTKFEIENRGVYGYVFAIQPIKRDEAGTEQHIWSEYWDGVKWIIVDPTWFLSSKKIDYFDKNNFHHIKFGTYHDIGELKAFLESNNAIRILPVGAGSTPQLTSQIDLLAFEDTYLNKEYKIIFENVSNQPLLLKSFSIELNGFTGVSTKNSTIEANKILMPGTKLFINIPLEYGFIVKKKAGSINIPVKFESLDGQQFQQNFTHSLVIKSNISNYISEIILGGIGFFIGISLVSFIILHKSLLKRSYKR